MHGNHALVAKLREFITLLEVKAFNRKRP